MSRYYNEKKFKGLLVILREPNSGGKEVNKDDNVWISDLLEGRKPYNYRRYEKAFRFYTEKVKLDSSDLSNCAFDNILDTGGNSSISPRYKSLKKAQKATRFLSITDQIKPRWVFTCNDIFDALLSEYADSCTLCSGGLYYPGWTRSSPRKRKLILKRDNREIEVFEIIHPSLSQNIENSAE